MSDGGESDHTGGREGVERSRRAGLVYRLRAAGRALVLLAACAVLTSVISTATGMYHHMDTTNYDSDEVAATADVGACRRTGPIAWDALGYWWECQVLVRTVEGRVVLVSVDRSMVTPADVGRPVEFLEICSERTGRCRYGVPEWSGHWIGYSFLTVVHVLAAAILIISALFFMKDAIFGERRTRKREDREPPAGRAPPSAYGTIDIARLLEEHADVLKDHAPPAPSRPPWSRDVTNG